MKYQPIRCKGCFTDHHAPKSKTIQGSTAESKDAPTFLQVKGIDKYWEQYDRKRGKTHHALQHRNLTLCEPKIEGTPRTPIFGQNRRIDRRTMKYVPGAGRRKAEWSNDDIERL